MTNKYLDKMPSRWTPPYRMVFIAIGWLCILAVMVALLFMNSVNQSERYADPEEIEVVEIKERTRYDTGIVTVSLRHKDGCKIVDSKVLLTKKGYEIRLVIDKTASDEGNIFSKSFYMDRVDLTVYICGNGKPRKIYTIT
ncbi:MAG: hypothetical protein IKA51_04845 [Clostridia bacterium]|nr:hypothetical protein [Clostridia bacterium]